MEKTAPASTYPSQVWRGLPWVKSSVFFLAAMLLMIQSTAAVGEVISARKIYMIDGDTIAISDQRFRLVGFDTPETRHAECSYELALGNEATRRARQLVENAGIVDLIVLPGRDKYGRGLARLLIQGEDLGSRLIAEGLARPYQGGRRQSWC